MEEISSLDSFHTDDADATTQPDSVIPKGDEEVSQTSVEKIATPENTSTAGGEDADADADIEGAAGDGAGDGDAEATKDSARDPEEAEGEGEDGGQNDEEFEQISEGTFEVDENSQTASTEPQPPDDGNSQDKPPEGEHVKNETKKDKADDAKSVTAVGDGDGGGGGGGDTQGSTEFEEVDANLSASGSVHNAGADESDMLGESDMTLPSKSDTEKKADDENVASAMDVDEEGDAEAEAEAEGGEEGETANVSGDVEMASVSNSPQAEKDENKVTEEAEEDREHDESMNEADQGTVNEEDDNDKDKDTVDKGEGDDEENKEKEKEDKEKTADKETNKSPTGTGEAEGVGGGGDEEEPEQEQEHEDEPVENVQEPEESDVCLIPDDTETEVTEAEKEQAILARENAEKEDAEAQAEKDKEKEKIAESKVQETTSEKDAEETAENEAAETSNAADNSEAPDPDEPLLEEMQTAGSGGTTKVIIAWIVASPQQCKQCNEQKDCGFRYKNPDSSEFEYLCDQACCDALITASPGKYFIRRKKFLVEEIASLKARGAKDDAEKEKSSASSEKGNDESESEKRMAEVAAGAHDCLQCKETKTCKYFFKQDDKEFYICSDDCFNLLSAEEPDKFKLKRHSIRVRNIGATTISSTESAPAPKANTGSAPESRVVARTAAEAEAARLERTSSFTRRCAECFSEVTLGDKNLLWETMDFCNEICLGKYQRTIGASCQTCHGEVPHAALGKYCVRFGFDIRQFCCASCLNEFKKGLKTCCCCQKDISAGNEGFLAPVGDKEQFKDFCSQACMRRYDSMVNPKKKLRNDICAVCNNDKPVRVEIMLDGKEHNFCSNPCFSAFKFVSNIVADQCGMCSKYFERKGSESYTIYTERRAKVFCSRVCLNVYIIVNRRIVSCQWCKVKKYNFDMIYKHQDAQEILMCSLNCLTLYGVSINAFSRTVAKCDNCNNSATPQYHLTMSDASMRNFCTYQCVMQFQSQFARAPLTLENEAQQQQSGSEGSGKNAAPFPTGLPKRVKLKVGSSQQSSGSLQIKLPSKTSSASKKGSSSLPVISTVSSLASGETETMIGNVTVRRGRVKGRKLDSPPPLASLSGKNSSSNSGPPNPPSGRGRPRKTPIDYTRSPSPAPVSPPRSSISKRGSSSSMSASASKDVSSGGGSSETKIITVPPYPPAVRNVQTSCKPQTITVGFQTEPKTATTATQTGKDYSNKVLIPVPVPIFVPQPMYMYSAPFPVPVPIPLPIPVPIFIPTTRNSAPGILKEIKKIQDKMPADPFEAELLMMAEMVAEEKRESDSDSDDEVKPDPSIVAAMQFGNNVQQVDVPNSNSYGEDVLQMALKMATGEYDHPTVDLESAMTANTITNPPPGMVDDSMSHMSGAHHMQQQTPPHHMMEPQRGGRGRKRGAIATPVSGRNNRASPVKRQRLQDIETSPQATPQTLQPLEKPDANMCLKYTFGVNAWKQWVMTKNADIEKSSMRKRPFKTELLQMTADELNYSLCLFVKEVRKPNGTEYAPDTIYYLVLGIQQYLYENGRIDNIFTDPYYERFTDCLDEVARKFSVLYNDSQYIVTRVEEEHLWECKQLGAHSPHVLLSTLMFFNTKHFNLTTVEEHMQLSFSHIMKHWKRTAQNAKAPGTRNVLLRFYPPQAGLDANPRKKKVYEQQENEENPLRCPVRLYEFYLSKCPESVKTRNDVFYLQPERSCVPDSPVWYSTQPLSQDALQKMLHRVKMVKEINIALLTS